MTVDNLTWVCTPLGHTIAREVFDNGYGVQVWHDKAYEVNVLKDGYFIEDPYINLTKNKVDKLLKEIESRKPI